MSFRKYLMQTVPTAIMFTCIMASTAHAQDEVAAADDAAMDSQNVAADPIIVTAQRRAENLQKVPLAINVMNSDALVSQGIERIEDLGGKIPGLTMQQYNGIVQPFLRGIGSSSQIAGVESSVAVYLDGVYFSRLPSAFFDLSNVERVEVLKGPQGTLFGRNSTGGVINVITRDPSYNTEIEGSVGYGRFDTFEGNLYASTGLSDSAAVSFSVSGKRSDGYGFNSVTGNRYAFDDNILANAKLMLEPSDATTATFSGFYGWSETTGTKGAYPGTSTIGNDYYFDQVLGLGLDIPRVVYGDNTPDAQPVDFYEAFNQPDRSERFESYGGSLRVNHDLGPASIVSISAYSHLAQDSVYDDQFPGFEFAVPLHARVDLFSQELQLVSNPGSAFDWIVGLYYLNNKTEYTEDSVFDVPLFYGDTPLAAPAEMKVETIAVFGQVGYNITPDLKLTAGLRYTWDKTSASGTQGGVEVYAPDTSKVDKPSYKVALDYQLTEEIMAYALYARGFKSGAYNIMTYSSPATDPEELEDYEIGLKTELFDRRVRFNVSAFYYDIKNPQVQLVQTGTTFLTNAEAAEVKGAEADINVNVAYGLSLRGGISHLDAKYTEYTNAPTGVPNFIRGGSDQLPNFDASGNRLPFAPKWSFNLGGDYSFDTSAGEVTLTADWFHNTGYTFEPDEFLRQGKVDLVNAQVKVQANENIAVRIWGKNLLDKKIIAGASSWYGAAGYSWTPAPPLTYGAAIDFVF